MGVMEAAAQTRSDEAVATAKSCYDEQSQAVQIDSTTDGAGERASARAGAGARARADADADADVGAGSDGRESCLWEEKLGLMESANNFEGTCAGSLRNRPVHDCDRLVESIVGFAFAHRIR